MTMVCWITEPGTLPYLHVLRVCVLYVLVFIGELNVCMYK